MAVAAVRACRAPLVRARAVKELLMKQIFRLEMVVAEEDADRATGLLTLGVPFGWEEESLPTGETRFRVHCDNPEFVANLQSDMHSFSIPLFRKQKGLGLLLGCLLALLALLPAATSSWAAAPAVRVLATTYPVYLLTRAVTKNSPEIQVDLLIPAKTGCPHDYALSPGDMRKLSQAHIVVMNGLGMEAFLQKALPAGIAIIDSSAGVAIIREAAEDAHEHEARLPPHRSCCAAAG